MMKTLIISFLIVLSLDSIAQDDSIFYEQYMRKGESKFKMLRKNDTSIKFQDVINAFNTAALIYPEKAELARGEIFKVFKYIESVKDTANAKTIEAFLAKRIADSLKQDAVRLNLSNAPYKYIRLIRDGPKDWSNLWKDTFNLKLIAYCNHLDTLKKHLDTIPEQKEAYAILREKLYYDNDLYEKIYKCLESDSKLEDFLLIPMKDTNYYNNHIAHFFTGGGEGFEFSEGALKITKGSKAISVTPPGKGQKFTAFALSKSKNPNLIICATDDNYIVVYDSSGFENNKPLHSIAMGTRVTALDFDESNNVILFGTISGDIGFIKYKADLKNQPVYDKENALDSKITAVDFFEYRGNSFLLVTGNTSKPVVYKIDDNILMPGDKFYGNILPKQDIGDISHAVFDASQEKVILETSKSGKKQVFLWDPFTESVLQKYKKFMSYEAPDQIYNEDEARCFIWINSKFY